MRHAVFPLVAGALVALALARPVQAQRAWNDSVSRALVERATERRARQLADSGLVDYAASAHGYVTFLAQVGEGFLLPPKIVKADELQMEVYWRAPNLSKQWIVGRRDTLLLPTDINYHRDHLGIIQNNFPEIIRLGDGDEVRDVAHPLSPSGLATYEFQLSDSLRFEIPGRTIDVYEVKIRPRDDRASAAVGAIYIAKDDGQVVRMAFSFTRAALKDKQLEDVSIVLENSLIEGRFWLPYRQEIEIRRTGSWMDFPARGIIRGRWEIRDYQVNSGNTVAQGPGPEISLAPPERRARHTWGAASILETLPDDVRLATDDDVRQVQEEARALVRAQALQRTRTTLPSVRSFSDVVRVTRAEGLAVGGGLRRRLGGGVDVGVLGRFGFGDHEAKGTLSLGWERADGASLRLRAFREYRDAGDEPETSRVRNTIAAQEFGSDYTQPFDTRGVTASVHLGRHAGLLWRLDGGYEWQESVDVAARPSRGRYEPTIDALAGRGPRAVLAVERPNAPWLGGSELRLRGEVRAGVLRTYRDDRLGAQETATINDEPGRMFRAFVLAEWLRPAGRTAVLARVTAGAARAQGPVPAQERIYAGGPVSGPGYDYAAFAGTTLSTQHLEWRFPVPFIPIRLGRWGRIPGQAKIVPFIHGVAVSTESDGSSGGWFPSVGLGGIALFDLLRVDVARGLKGGRWTLSLDVSRDFWPIL
ncbi:MAG: hypothetical protein ABIP66_03515 [Gemmatimonadaceae bacterium]